MPTVRKIPPPTADQLVDAPTGFPALTRDDVRAWVGEVMLQRGAVYVGDALFDLRWTGRTLKAGCQGTASQPYRIEATIESKGGVEHDDCTCPVGGRCKHVAALLIAWLEDPDAFAEGAEVEAALEGRTKAELIALIRQMLARSPELEALLELPLPVADAVHKPADPALIRRKVAAAFREAGHEWGATADIAQRLETLVQMGDGYADLGDWQSAAAIYQTIARGVTEHYYEVHDESGDLHTVVNDCVSGMDACLRATADPSGREALLQSLFDIYRWDVDFGGIDMGYEAPSVILNQATPEEHRLVAGWTRDALAATDPERRQWGRQRFGGFLLRLAGDQIGDEEFLRICRETGRRRDLVERLLALGRVDVAETEVRQASDDELLDLADLLCRHGHGERAEQLVREHQPGPHWQERYTSWLRERLRERGDITGALALSEDLFWRRPDLSRYDELKTLAETHGSWVALRPDVRRRLERERQYVLLTEIHLREDDVAQAIKTVRLASVGGSFTYAYGGEPLSIRVALAASHEFTREAIELYEAAAERLIRAQGRENYAVAARYLTRVRDLHHRLGEGAAWITLIGAVRERNRRLRALRDELDRAGL
jgi:uncharacterized Zn finger protein